MDFEKQCCPVVEVDGAIACGKQFDLDITLPCDNRNVIYGVIKDCYKEPVKNAVVKLVEVVCECGKEERRPVTHTFTDEDGEFVFGPLCPDKKYEINFWVDQVKHFKVCAKCSHEGKCLVGTKMNKCDKKDKYDYDKDDKCDEKDEYDYDKEDKCDKKDEYNYDKEDKCDKKDEYDYNKEDKYNKKDEKNNCCNYKKY